MRVELLPHQHEFVADIEHKFLALIAGYGAGKTYSLINKAIYLAYLNQGYTGILYEPTTPLLHDILIPDFEKFLNESGIPYTLKKTPNYNYYLHFPDGDSLIMLRAMENWQRHIGVNAAWIGADEVDTIKKPLAKKAVEKLMGRIRSGLVRQFFFTTTPEGFEFMYHFFVERDSPLKRRIHASSLDNPYLPKDFIDSLYENYDAELVKAYIHGQFVNLTSGAVYRNFDREKNATDRTIQPGDVLHIGMDFNIEKMAAVVHVEDRNTGKVYAVDEIVDIRDTFEMSEEIFRRYRDHKVLVYPDAAGDQRHTSATLTDIQILRQRGIHTVFNPKNPPVRERVMRMNSMFCNAYGERKYFVNIKKCPNYVSALEKLVYKNGVPDKDSGYDHITDAAGYYIYKFAPKIRTKPEPKPAAGRYGDLEYKESILTAETDGLV